MLISFTGNCDYGGAPFDVVCFGLAYRYGDRRDLAQRATGD